MNSHPHPMTTQPEMADWLSPSQAARLLGLTPRRIRQMSAEGILSFEQTPLGRAYRREHIEQVKEARENNQREAGPDSLGARQTRAGASLLAG